MGSKSISIIIIRGVNLISQALAAAKIKPKCYCNWVIAE